MSSKPWLTRPQEYLFWSHVAAGAQTAEAARRVGLGVFSGKKIFRERGGVNPGMSPPGAGGRLTIEEREEIMVRRARREGVRAIAVAIGRDASTVSRELRRGRGPHDRCYTAHKAQRLADRRAARPKPTKLAASPALAAHVRARLDARDSPEQIAGRLRLDHPDDPEMRVSHETIYKELYLQARGALRKDLARRLRTGRAVRRPRGRGAGTGGGPRFPGMVMISERPAEADDRAVPGHWEGDLITGAANRSAIGTLVERTSGYVQLLHLPDGHGADAVADAVAATMAALPDRLRRTLAWDQGSEMAAHLRIAEAAGIDVYFCDPHSPWQRATNENTNGLLRQYYPKGTDLSAHGPDNLESVADALNNRPRKRHGWRTPAEVIQQVLSPQPPGVAPTT
jgi:IS30 family transposase